jgi:hypothetical protein
MYGLMSPRTNRCYYDRLRKLVLTDSILAAAGVDKRDYAKIHVFTAFQSNNLRRLLDLNEEGMEE